MKPLAAALLLTAAAIAGAEPRALLVGVSEYPTLDASLQLAGPRNDVLAWRAMLVERGVPAFGIRMLADGVPGAALPTRDNIIAELERLGQTARTGDQIVLFFAGHGSQQPGGYGEADGLTEIFLPRDVGRWQPTMDRPGGAVHNAIADHELRARIDRIGDQGAFVWAVFDSCHAASMVRGGANEPTVTRSVAPAQLGVPEATAARAVNGPDRPAPRAGAVYFYASQSHETAPEMPLPPRRPGAVRHGLFSFSLLQTLSGGAGMSYRQLAQAVLLDYGARGVGTSTTPQFSGTALDAPVLGQTAAPVRQWALQRDGTGLHVSAGALADLQPGAVLAVLPAATSNDDALLGFVRVGDGDAMQSHLLPTAFAGRREAPLSVLQRGAVARLVAAAPAAPLTVTADISACGSPCTWIGALARLRMRPSNASWPTDGSAADLRLAASGDRLWLLPAGFGATPCIDGSATQRDFCAAVLERTLPSLIAAHGTTDERLADAMAQMLESAGRATQLLRTAGRWATAPETGLRAEVTLLPRGAPALPWRGGSVPELASGDRVRVVLRNGGTRPADATVLLVDGRYGIDPLFPPPGALNRIESKGELPLEFELSNAETAGIERLVIIATQAEALSERLDFSLLAQPALPGHRVVRGEGIGARTSIQVVTWRLK